MQSAAARPIVAAMKDAYSLILAAIEAGTYRPGDRLVESELADRLGVSRTPVREAFLRLQAEGLLAAEPRCTRVVAEPDIRNAPSLRAFTAAGFRTVGDISLPDKTAALLVYPRSEEDMP